MKYLNILLFIVLFSIISCKKTENHIGIETMSSIIIDSKKAEALVQILYSDSNEQEDILNQFNGDILKKYNVSIESYQASIEYYKDNPKEMDKLITSIKLKRAKTNVD